MTRSILAALAAAVAVTIVTGTGCNSTGVGDPCVPEAEYDPSFLGFAFTEVNVESRSFQCQTRLCLANHFQGRATCPYGQNSTGTAAGSASFDGTNQPCFTPIDQPVTGVDPTTGKVNTPPAGNPATAGPGAVLPNCSDRTADKAVYCSCRCADVDGNQPSDQVFCTCPTGFTCTQLVSSIGATDSGLTGAYCIKNGTAFDPSSGSCSNTCTAGAADCGPAQGVK